METNLVRGRFGLMRPRPLSVAFTDADGTLSNEKCHRIRKDGSDGFLPVMTAAALIASALIIALD
jgi:hypothetical protein